MEALPETKYARSGDLSIAYQVMGDGPIDLVVVPGFASHMEFLHEVPGYTHWLRGLASFARVIRFDKRGGGQGSISSHLVVDGLLSRGRRGGGVDDWKGVSNRRPPPARRRAGNRELHGKASSGLPWGALAPRSRYGFHPTGDRFHLDRTQLVR
jgi:hypothetical protein